MRVLSNLMNNAVEASEHLEIIPIVIELKKMDDGTLMFKIDDKGKGLSADRIEYLKNKNASFGKENGHGLGLLHLKEFLSHHHGTFEIESIPEKQTSIQIKIPRLPEDYIQIVHIDDEAIVRLLWKKKAHELGVSILSLSHPQEIFQFVENLSTSQSRIYCDLYFQNSDVTGINTLDSLKELGFENLYLASGVTSKYAININNNYTNIGKMFPAYPKKDNL